MKEIINELGALVVTIGIIILVSFVIGTYYLRNENTRLTKEVNYYEKTYPIKNGVTCLWPGSHGQPLSYQLRSLDGGRNWYVTSNFGGNVYILGKVIDIYPGLLSYIDAMDAVYERTKYSPLELNNSNDVQLLINAGFQIRTN